ncbi:MAG: LPS assembly protein LptD [Deferrisomatales bacterium]|nr:LPS assembly protein LptD [Deferrisomatales bacterium]
MLRSILLISLITLVAGPASAQEFWSLRRETGGDAVALQADSLSALQGSEEVRAEGHVVLRWREFRLLAERVTFRPGDGVARAEGQVVLEDGDGNVLECSRLEINTVTEQGEVTDGSLWIAREGYRVWGKHLRKTGANSYTVQDGGFTACDGTWPSWRVQARELEVELEGYLVGRGAAFWVEGVPLLYTPYLLFPVKRERQSGFLFPKFGYTSTDGLYGALRYYWVISDNADATLEGRYRSQRGWEERGEVRYVLAEGHAGRIAGTHLWDRLRDAHRYTVEADHVSRFDDASRARVQVNYAGDTDYQRDLGDTLDDRGVQRTRSFAVGTHDVGAGSLFGLAEYFQSLTDPQGEVLQTLPQFGLLGRETPLVGPLVWSPTVRGTRFWRGQGLRGERLEVVPGLGASGSLGALGLAARSGYRQNIYRVDDEWTARGGADAQLDAELTLARPFGAVLHTLEPRLSLQWEEEGRGGAPPGFDHQDEFAHTTTASLQLENRLLTDTGLRTLAALDLDARYELGASRWLPLRGELDWFPSDAVSLGAAGEYDPGVADPWLSWSAQGDLRDRRGDRLFAGYRYLKQEAGYLDAGLEIAVRRVLTLQYRNRYSARETQILEESYGAQLHHPCWAVQVTYSRNWQADENRYDHRYYAQLEIAGLGRLGALKGLLP